MAALRHSPSTSSSVYAGCELVDDGDSIFSASTLVGSEGGAALRARQSMHGAAGIANSGQGSTQSPQSQPLQPPPRDEEDNYSLATETSTLRNVPRASQPPRRDPARPIIDDRTPSGISFSRAYQRAVATDYRTLEDHDNTPVQLRRASIDSTATDLLHRSAAAANQDGSLVVPWWNTMLPSPLMNRQPRNASTGPSATLHSSGRQREDASNETGPSTSASSSPRSRVQSLISRGGGGGGGSAAQQTASAAAASGRPSFVNRAMSLGTTQRTPQQTTAVRQASPLSPHAQVAPTNYSSDGVVNVVPPIDPAYTPSVVKRHSAMPSMQAQHATTSSSRGAAETRNRPQQSVSQRSAGSQTQIPAQRQYRRNSQDRRQRIDGRSTNRPTADKPTRTRPAEPINTGTRTSEKQRARDTSRAMPDRQEPGPSGHRRDQRPAKASLKKSGPQPPRLPKSWDFYTKCYCEENAYFLATYLLGECQKRNRRNEALLQEGHVSRSLLRQWTVDVVFVSNQSKTVALWQQRASALQDADYVVVWDYHVFLAVTCQPAKSENSAHASILSQVERQTWIYDVDSHMQVPSRLSEYLTSTFRYGTRDKVAAPYQPRFRIIPAIDFLAHFASDRSHMWTPESRWSSLPPTWNAIRGPFSKTRNNLMEKYVDLSGGTQGIVVGNIVPTADEARTFGIVVSLDELSQNKQLSGLACLGRSSLTASRKEDNLDFVVDKNVRELLADEGFGANDVQGPRHPADRRTSASSSASHSTHSSSEEGAEQSIAMPTNLVRVRDSYIDGRPGMLLGGTRRVYGVRPPPAPPGHDPLHHRPTVNFSGRGKRVSNALFPAYLHASLESRAQHEREAAARASAAAAAAAAGGR